MEHSTGVRHWGSLSLPVNLIIQTKSCFWVIDRTKRNKFQSEQQKGSAHISGEQKKDKPRTHLAGLSSILLRPSGAQWIVDLFYLAPQTKSLLYTCGGWGIENGESMDGGQTGRESGRINLRLQKTASNDSWTEWPNNKLLLSLHLKQRLSNAPLSSSKQGCKHQRHWARYFQIKGHFLITFSFEKDNLSEYSCKNKIGTNHSVNYGLRSIEFHLYTTQAHASFAFCCIQSSKLPVSLLNAT